MSEQQPEARAVCEHFYASHCYRGMSIRLCMTCHEPDWDDLAEQLASAARGSEIAAGEPLVMPPDEPCGTHMDTSPPVAAALDPDPLPAVLDALRLAAADAEYGARAKRFMAALTALGGDEEETSRG